MTYITTMNESGERSKDWLKENRTCLNSYTTRGSAPMNDSKCLKLCYNRRKKCSLLRIARSSPTSMPQGSHLEATSLHRPCMKLIKTWGVLSSFLLIKWISKRIERKRWILKRNKLSLSKLSICKTLKRGWRIEDRRARWWSISSRRDLCNRCWKILFYWTLAKKEAIWTLQCLEWLIRVWIHKNLEVAPAKWCSITNSISHLIICCQILGLKERSIWIDLRSCIMMHWESLWHYRSREMMNLERAESPLSIIF